MARTFSAVEIAADAGVPQDRLAWLVSIGMVKPEQPGEFRFGDVFRVKLVSALLDAGLPKALLGQAVAEGWLRLDHVDAYLPLEPARRSNRTFATSSPRRGRQRPICLPCTRSSGCPGPIPRFRST
jgi:hypothetical protein